MLTGLSHPRAITRIPDPIHSSFELTLFDRDLVDTNEFQRLHYVLQQSTMYASFPSNKNSRFSHSIGTAHVASQLFASALSNAETGVLRGFLSDAGLFLEELTNYLTETKGMAPAKGDPLTEMMGAHRATISGMSRFLHRPLMQADGAKAVDSKWRVDTNEKFGASEQLDASFIIDTLWQALRIYGLAHDIGHLPMSHAFEHAIVRVSDGISEYNLTAAEGVDPTFLLSEANKRFSGSAGLDDKFFNTLEEMLGASRETVETEIVKKAVHEIRSYGILNDYLVRRPLVSSCFPALAPKLAGEIDNYCKLVHNAALCIIYSICREQPTDGLEPKHQFLYAMRQLVDGEIDGDRLDYTLRDCYSSGVKFGSFDLGRIVDNALLLRPKSGPGEKLVNDSVVFGFGPRAVSGIEQFFEARSQSYRYLVHHRTASRSNKAVETLVEKLFVFSFIYPSSECAKILRRYDFLQRKKRTDGKWYISEILPVSPDDDAANANERLDDATLRTLLQEIVRLFSSKKNLASIADDKVRHSMALEIGALCDVILNRGFSNIVTMFKHHSSDSFLKEVLEIGVKRDRDKFSQKLLEKGELGRFFESLRQKMADEQENGDFAPISFMYELVKAKTFSARDPQKDDIEKIIWIQRPIKKVGELSGVCLPISTPEISASLSAMSSTRGAKPGIRIYAAAKGIKMDEDISKRAENRLVDALKAHYQKYR